MLTSHFFTFNAIIRNEESYPKFSIKGGLEMLILFGIVVMIALVNLYYLLKQTNQHLQRIEDLLTRLIDKKD